MKTILSGFGFFSGTTYPFRLLGVFKSHPHLFSYIIVPIIINIILGLIIDLSLGFLGWEISQTVMENLMTRLDAILANFPSWLGGLDYLLIGLVFLVRFLLAIFLLMITGFILVQFGVILGAPWYGKLSEQLENLRTGTVEIVEVGMIRDICRAILFEVKKIGLVIMMSLPLLLVNFIPVVGTLLATIGGITLTSTIICLDFFDGVLERRRLKFREKLGIIWKSLPASAGFALICLFLVSVPLLNLLTIPFCVGGGTLFVCDRVLEKGLLSNH